LGEFWAKVWELWVKKNYEDVGDFELTLLLQAPILEI
jgi:hypothetical protein